MGNVAKAVEARIKEMGEGAIFFHSDFADLGPSEATRKAVKRLCDRGVIRRCARGIYNKPEYGTFFGHEEIAPSSIDLAKAYARNKGINLYMTEDAALNLLGLDTQNQMKTVYLTDGPSVMVKTVSGGMFKLDHTSDKNLAHYSSRKMQLLNLALSGYDRTRIDIEMDEETKDKIRHIVSEIDNQVFSHDIKLMTSWKRNLIYSLLRSRS